MSGRRYLQLNFSNIPASGKVSHARGNPVLTATIGRQDADLDLSSIRISGDLDIFRDAGGVNRPTAGAASELRASHKLGIYGAIDQLIFRNAETKQVVEHIRHYGRFMSSFLPAMAASSDYQGHLGESALMFDNFQMFRNAVIRNTQSSPFSIPLPSGMTLGTGMKLPLSKMPLEIEIHLVPDSQFFFSADGVTTNVADCFYELSKLKLSCEVEPESKAPDSGVMTFNTITSYFSTIETTNSIINYRLGLSNVLGAFVNFVPSSFVNNLGQDGYLTYMPSKASSGDAGGGQPAGAAGGAVADLLKISFLRNGERFPKMFETDCVFEPVTNVTPVVDSEVIKSFMSSIVPESHHVRTSVSPDTTNRNFTVSNNTLTGYRNMPCAGATYGVGVLYDMLDSQGVDFSEAQFSIQMENGLDDGNPVSAYLFIKSKVVVAYSEKGVQIVS
tara:strand:- start:8686 stop:10020 length:1335 start_codon:yes stop_codon:yes gene_type:complete